MLVGLLGVNMGLVFLDRNAFGLLAPMIQPEFGLTLTQVGMITGMLAVTWSLASFGLNRAADLTGRCKLLLVLATVIFSIASISSGLATGLLSLLAARALMGLAEGGLPPLTLHIVTSEVAPERRGLAVGSVTAIQAAMGLLGPLVIVGIGTLYGWRQAFWLAGVPGLILAALIWALVRNPDHQRTDDAPKGSIMPLLKTRNIRFTMLLATLNMTMYVGILGFLPLYLVNVLDLSNAMMGVVVTTQTVALTLFIFLAPTLSDRIGRKPVIFGSFLIGILGLLVLAFSHGSLPLVFAGSILAGCCSGTAYLIMVIVPGESAPAHLKATAMGLNAAVGEMLGAGAMPVLIGMAADRFGFATLPWILIAVAVLTCLITLGLRETAPRLVARAG
jgi:ACS family hexuronate transporter-like MFS transporter